MFKGKLVFIFLVALLMGDFTIQSNAFAEDAVTTAGFHDDTEGGVVIVTGNSQAQSYNLLQSNEYGWDSNILKLNAKYLENETNSVTTARYWIFGLRYERQLPANISAYAGESAESDPFSGYLQRYNTDVGGKYMIIKDEHFTWSGEAGYRYVIENRQNGQFHENFVRLFTELNRDWTKTFSTKYWLEGLPNLTNSTDYQVNTELSGSAAINDVFSIKLAYLVKYRNLLVGTATVNTDTLFSTSLVAKF